MKLIDIQIAHEVTKVPDENRPAPPAGPKRTEVWKMFDRIAGRYDLLNRLLSFGQDVRWRNCLAEFVPDRESLELLDVATGTGDVMLALCQKKPQITKAFGVDMAPAMLALAKKKIVDKNLQDRLTVMHADACQLPFADKSFDLVTIAFGIRNVTNTSAALKEMRRVLRENGKALILEFSLPSNKIIKMLYLFYFRRMLPALGGIISGDNYAYRYLNETVETFPYGQKFRQIMEQAGFSQVEERRLTFGVATIYEGRV